MWMYINFLVVAAAVAAISMCISRSKIFKPMRQSLNRRAHAIYELVSCAYCLSHWVSLVAALFFRLNVTPWAIVNYVITAFALVAIVPVFAGRMFEVYRVMPPPRDMHDVEEFAAD